MFKLVDGHVKILVVVSDSNSYIILDTEAQINSINSACMQKMALNLAQGKRLKVPFL